MQRLRRLTAILPVCLALCAHAFGMAGDLNAPSLSFPTNYESRESVMKVLADKQFKFLRGHFVNAASTLMYSGEADSLNLFIAMLAQCKGAKVSVSFTDDTDDSSWTLGHNAWGDADAFHIVVNTAHIAKAAVKIPK